MQLQHRHVTVRKIFRLDRREKALKDTIYRAINRVQNLQEGGILARHLARSIFQDLQEEHLTPLPNDPDEDVQEISFADTAAYARQEPAATATSRRQRRM